MTAPTVVTNAGPLMVLSKLNLLYILKHLYTNVHIPRSVYEETVVKGVQHGYEDAKTLQTFLSQQQWKAVDVSCIPLDLLETTLDRGERDAIALALTLKSLLLIDEECGREEARQRGLKVRGSLGVLVEAYQQKMFTMDQMQLYFSQIEQRTDIWISPTLCRQVLAQIMKQK